MSELKPAPPSLFFANSLIPSCKVHRLPATLHERFIQEGRVLLTPEWLADDENEPEPGPCLVVPEGAENEIWDDISAGLKLILQRTRLGTFLAEPTPELRALSTPSLYELLPQLATGQVELPAEWLACVPKVGIPSTQYERVVRWSHERSGYLGLVQTCSCEEIGCGGNYAWAIGEDVLLFLNLDTMPVYRFFLFPQPAIGPLHGSGLLLDETVWGK